MHREALASEVSVDVLLTYHNRLIALLTETVARPAFLPPVRDWWNTAKEDIVTRMSVVWRRTGRRSETPGLRFLAVRFQGTAEGELGASGFASGHSIRHLFSERLSVFSLKTSAIYNSQSRQ